MGTPERDERDMGDKGDLLMPGAPQPAQVPSAASEIAALREEMGVLFSMLSHDLRTPLSAISGWLHLLEMGKLDAAGQQRALARIRSNIDGQVRLLDDAVLFARSRSQTLEISLQAVQFDEHVEAAVQSLAGPAVEKGVVVGVRGPFEGLEANADPELLQRVLEVLLRRSIEATPQHGLVEVRPVAGADGPGIAIHSGGKGYAPEDLPELRESLALDGTASRQVLSRVDRALLLAHVLVDAQGGRMIVDSAGVDRGTTVTIALRRSVASE